MKTSSVGRVHEAAPMVGDLLESRKSQESMYRLKRAMHMMG